MKKTLDPTRIADKVLDALKLADEKYNLMSGGWPLYYAPEYYATARIAEAIAKDGKRYAALEVSPNDAFTHKKRNHDGNGSIPKQGRFDIALWGPGATYPVGIVEVKLGTFFTFGSVAGDVVRACDALNQARNLKWAMCVLYFACFDGVSKPASERVTDRTGTIIERAKAYARSEGMSCRGFSRGPFPQQGQQASIGKTALVFKRRRESN